MAMMSTKPRTPRITIVRPGIDRFGVRIVVTILRRRRVSAGDAVAVRVVVTRSLISGVVDEGRVDGGAAVGGAAGLSLLFPEIGGGLAVGVDLAVAARCAHDGFRIAQPEDRHRAEVALDIAR